jgi:hypothetical protein
MCRCNLCLVSSTAITRPSWLWRRYRTTSFQTRREAN